MIQTQKNSYTKIDHRKEMKEYYNPSKGKVTIIEVPALNYLSLMGKGHPNEPFFQEAAETLYPLAYTLKFMVRKSNLIDFHVMPMEVVWTLIRNQKTQFKWNMMLMQPEFITPDLITSAMKTVQEKFELPQLSNVQFTSIREGKCVQMLHCGPYDKMNDTLSIMKTFAEEKGFRIMPDTHDIYLNDVRKTRPENIKAIMRAKIISKI